jgi:tetratricopeptide (TPR) repeat protein
VGGILFSLTSRDVNIATNVEQSSLTWGNIEVNKDLPADYFVPTRFTRTPLQEFLDKLYAERSDTSSVQWSYHAFRQAYPDIDTREGVEVIGYQMLKMNDFAGAIAVLSLNARDYPQSSTSAFALGRAYRTAGDTAKAKAELNRALALDPSNKRAADALAALTH